MAKFRFIAGAAVGAVAALLLAPRTGKETRALVAGKIDDAVDAAPQPIQDVADNVRNRAAAATDEVAPTTDDIRAKINEARDRIAEQIARSQGAEPVDADVVDVDDVKEAAEDAVDDIAEKISDIAASVSAAVEEDVNETIEEPAEADED